MTRLYRDDGLEDINASGRLVVCCCCLMMVFGGGCCVCGGGGGLCCGSEEVSGPGRILREVLGQFFGREAAGGVGGSWWQLSVENCIL